MPYKRGSLKARFAAQRKAAKGRGILFLLTFEEWLTIWKRSGKLTQRGVRKGQYVMARHGDIGPYSKSNVKIILAADNSREGHFVKMSERHKQAIRAGYRKRWPVKPSSHCECGCNALASPGKSFIHGHSGRVRFREINAARIGKPRAW